MKKYLHIVSFDVPLPANYGGVIDVYYKIKALNELGVNIILHCFSYGRKKSEELDEVCDRVYYYKRSTNKKYLLSSLPYIVISRSSGLLINNLLADSYPILFEGLHTCYYLNDERLINRVKIVRMHNIEHDYYKSLGEVETSVFKKKYFEYEAGKLAQYEKVLNNASKTLAISKSDYDALNTKYNNVELVSAFHGNRDVAIKKGLGLYCLYHGNLSVGENNKAALFLVNEVFNNINIPLVIAGTNPSKELKKAVLNKTNITLRYNVSDADMNDLIRNAQINVLPTFQDTGIKLKLINSLFNGRFCIGNSLMVNNTGLELLCITADTSFEFVYNIKRLFVTPFDMKDVKKREKVLMSHFSNEDNALKIIDII